MATWDSYTQKSTPADNDTLMIKDTSGGANKRTPFSGVWNWIVSKLASAVISQLETTNKSIIPAINELNSKTQNNPIEYFPTTEANFPKYCYEHIEQNSTKAFYVSTNTENKLDKYIPGNNGGTATCIRGSGIMTIVYTTVNRDLYIGVVSANSVDTGGAWKSYDGVVYNFD